LGFWGIGGVNVNASRAGIAPSPACVLLDSAESHPKDEDLFLRILLAA